MAMTGKKSMNLSIKANLAQTKENYEELRSNRHVRFVFDF